MQPGPLPLPSLKDTLDRHLSSLAPLITNQNQRNKVKTLITNFKQKNGKKYQAILQEKQKNTKNWIETWWEQFAYLKTRQTMAIHVNWFGVMPDWGLQIKNSNAAAAMIHALHKVKQMLDQGKYPVEKLRGAPLDMHQFTRVFGMTRIPKDGCDELQQTSDARHIVVMRRGAIYKMVIYDDDGYPLPLSTLQAQLETIMEMSRTIFESEDEPPISVLTSMERDEWASERERLLQNTINRASLSAIEGALFCLALDDKCPNSKEEVARLCHGGDGTNRWFDKSFTIVVFENGRGGINAEHTPVDAMTIVSIYLKVLDRVRILALEELASLVAPACSLDVSDPFMPQKLAWEVTPLLRATLEVASAEIFKLCNSCDIKLLSFSHFGKGLVKRSKLHPDFFMQMAIQLAYYRLHGRFVATYETGHTRAFHHGRTDTVRTLSVESCAFVRCMEDESIDCKVRYEALRKACDAHGEQVQRVLTGQGIDRHLLGLYIVAASQGDVPELFTDESFKLSGGGGNYILSTSNVGYTPMCGGFAPMTPDGYGVCYSILEGRMNISVTTWRTCKETDAPQMCESLSKALCDMMYVCSERSKASSKL